jgi:hypothetical protein
LGITATGTRVEITFLTWLTLAALPTAAIRTTLAADTARAAVAGSRGFIAGEAIATAWRAGTLTAVGAANAPGAIGLTAAGPHLLIAELTFHASRRAVAATAIAATLTTSTNRQAGCFAVGIVSIGVAISITISVAVAVAVGIQISVAPRVLIEVAVGGVLTEELFIRPEEQRTADEPNECDEDSLKEAVHALPRIALQPCPLQDGALLFRYHKVP